MSWRVPSVALIPGVRTLSRWERYRIRFPGPAQPGSFRTRRSPLRGAPLDRSTACASLPARGPRVWMRGSIRLAHRRPATDRGRPRPAGVDRPLDSRPALGADRRGGADGTGDPEEGTNQGLPDQEDILARCARLDDIFHVFEREVASGRRASSSLERLGSSAVSVCTSANTGCRSERRTAGTGSP